MPIMAMFGKFLLAGVAILVLHVLHRRRLRNAPGQFQDRCGRLATLWSRDVFFHLDFSISLHTDLDSTVRHHAQKGRTYVIDSLLGSHILHTVAPENLHVIYSQGKDFGVQSSRLPAMEYFCGQGFLTTDGSSWSRSRKMLKPTFAKSNISELSFLNREVETLISNIKNGESFDLQTPLLVTVRTSNIYVPCVADRFSS